MEKARFLLKTGFFFFPTFCLSALKSISNCSLRYPDVSSALDKPVLSQNIKLTDLAVAFVREVEAINPSRRRARHMAKQNRLAIGRPGGECVVSGLSHLPAVAAVGIADEDLETLADEV